MNTYQKVGVLLTRIVGAAIALRALVEPIHFHVVRLSLPEGAPQFTFQWMGIIVWLACGLILILLAEPMGRFLGRGLD